MTRARQATGRRATTDAYHRPGALLRVVVFCAMAGLAGAAACSGSSAIHASGSGGRGSGGVAAGSGGAVGADAAGGTGGAAKPDAAAGGDVFEDDAPTVTVGYSVEVDPYGTSPLVAVVNLHGIEASKVQQVQVMVAGQNGGPDLVRTYSPTDTELAVNLDSSDVIFPEPGYHVPVLGLYADRESAVRILVDVRDQGRVDLSLSIETSLTKPGETPWVPSVQVKTAAGASMEPGWTVAEISIEPNPNPPIVLVEWTRTIAFDETGAIRWALRLDGLPKGETFTLRRSISGTFLTGSFDTVVEVTKLGRILRTFKLADYTLNHEIVQIGSADNAEGVPSGTKSKYAGHILVLASKNEASTIQDHILELDAETGEVLDTWDLAQVLDATRMTYIDAERWDISQNGDWLHDNGLAYSTADESIIVSGRHQGVAKIRRDGTLVWLLAPHKAWNEPQAGKLLTAVDASQTPYADAVQLGTQAAGTASTPEFDWPFGQHSPVLLPNGDLLLFDNGASRHFKGFCGSFSRAVIYRIDEAAMTVRQMGQFILSKAESACYTSNTYRLPVTGNLFIEPGFTNGNVAVAKEVTTQVATDGTLAFDQVVFDAAIDMSVVDTSRWYVYAFRGHRWTF
jgi:arylsulfate sulfotransferase